MKFLNKSLQTLLIMFTALQLTACARTVQWEEEVLLNTGETIWVSKEVRYSVKGQPGNPADLGYIPDYVETTSFKYGGRNFSYTGEAGITVLAISPLKQPVLLAPASSRAWYRHHNYQCITPYYVQLTTSVYRPRGQAERNQEHLLRLINRVGLNRSQCGLTAACSAIGVCKFHPG